MWLVRGMVLIVWFWSIKCPKGFRVITRSLMKRKGSIYTCRSFINVNTNYKPTTEEIKLQ
jgi:hypothetical protein